MATGKKSGLAVIDVQEDFCEPDGSLAVKGGRDLATVWNDLLSLPFAVKLATRDYHPKDHISFASQHSGKEPFTSSHTIKNPENHDDEPGDAYGEEDPRDAWHRERMEV